MMAEEMEELAQLLDKVAASENLYARAETYYLTHSDEWSPGVRAYFRDILERKLDQINYEWHRVHQLGLAIATGRALRQIDHDI